MSEEKKEKTQEKREMHRTSDRERSEISETWAEETIADLDEFIESQGIYIRQ